MTVEIEQDCPKAYAPTLRSEDTQASVGAQIDWRADLINLVALLCIEVLVFGLIVKDIGFYLDDWATFCQLHFARLNFIDLWRSSMADPRMVTRPFQCIYYAASYLCFQDNPLGYHVLRCTIEFAGAAFLYAGAARLFNCRVTALIAAILFIVFPSHDASHYWIGAGLGAGCGITLYLLSWSLAVFSVVRRSTPMAVFSAMAFLLCAYCYEAFLPMLSLTFFSVLYIELQRRHGSPSAAFLKCLRWMLPCLAIGVSEPIYQRAIVPMFAKVFLSPGTFDLRYSVGVFTNALAVNFGSGWAFFLDRAKESVASLKSAGWLRLAGVALITLASSGTAIWLHRLNKPSSYTSSPTDHSPMAASTIFAFDDKTDGERPPNTVLYWTASSVIVLLCSYLTFAVAQGYTPTLYSMINRVNTGASVAMCLLLSVVIAKPGVGRGNLQIATTLIASTLLVVFFTLADWGFTPYWTQSNTVQAHVQKIIKDHASTLATGDTVMLANTPRYVMWAPVFDGVWDFQSLVWMTTNNRNINGGVVSERLDVSDHDITDNSAGFRCATYNYKGLKVLIPNGEQLIPASTADEFISIVEQKGMTFGLSPQVLNRWKARGQAGK